MLERLRDLFEQALADVPADDAPEFYIKYAKAEVIHKLFLFYRRNSVTIVFWRKIFTNFTFHTPFSASNRSNMDWPDMQWLSTIEQRRSWCRASD